jgi:hypothetical protein
MIGYITSLSNQKKLMVLMQNLKRINYKIE